MKCILCKHDSTDPGATTVTLERQGVTVVVREVPAQICANCGEAYVAASVSDRLLAIAKEAAESGIEVEIRHYKAA